jgi:predicted GNAT family N-acyltransferase
MQILQIEFATPEYDEAVRLRHEVLCRPLGLEFSPEQLAAEYSDIHLGAFDVSGRLIACLCLTPLSDGEVQMRQVATAVEQQGKGVGSKLVAASEELAMRLSFKKIILYAHDAAVAFYLKLDYQTVGEPFEEASIRHFKMEKSL